MKHSEGRFVGTGGHSLYFQCWEPEVALKGVLVLAHGAGEHSGRYLHVAQYFTGFGYAIAALDHQGHGYSEGRPGFVSEFRDYVCDLETFHQIFKERFRGLPMFLLGHSMGGLIASLYLIDHQAEFVGAILSGPAISTDLAPGKLQLTLLSLVATLLPHLGILKLDPTGVSRDDTVVQAYVDDPLVFHGKMSARMASQLFTGMQAIQADAGKITLPMLIMHGGADVLTAPRGSRLLYEAICSRDKALQIYPGLYHEIFNEPERSAVLAEVLEWCDARLPVR